MTSKKDSSVWRAEVPVDWVFCEDAYRRVLLKADAEQTPAGDPFQHRALHNLCFPGRLNEGTPCSLPPALWVPVVGLEMKSKGIVRTGNCMRWVLAVRMIGRHS